MKKLIYITIALVGLPFLVKGQSTDQNYVKSTVYQQPYSQVEVETADQPGQELPDDDLLENVVYYDGLGRPIEAINARGGANRENIVQYTEYDYSGVQSREYLPWATFNPGVDEDFIDPGTLREDIHAFYDTGKYENTLNPYGQVRFEPSPLMRVLEQGAPGNPWVLVDSLDTDHTIKFAYVTNGLNEVYEFSIDFTSGNTDQPNLVYNGVFAPGELTKTVTKDENWQPGDGDAHTTQEFKNNLGQVVLKRTFNAVSGPFQFSTYYVYDDFGNLTFVLSPEASAEIIDNGALVSNHQTLLDVQGYQYKYDNRNRLIEKKIPGKDWEYIIYDDLDRPILTQDGLQRANSQWLFTKYDKFSRVVYTGIYNSGASRSSEEQTIQGLQVYNEERQPGVNTIGNTDLYYTNAVYPTSNIDVLTVNYYDDYVDTGNLAVPTTVMGITTTNDLQGLPTVSKVRVLDLTASDWITIITGYDNKGRAIYTASENEYLDTTDEVQSLLDFTGKPLESITTHTRGTSDPVVTNDYFIYDHAGRLLTHKQKVEEEVIQLIAENVYDELGQLVIKNVGGETVADGLTDITNADVNTQGVISKNSGTDQWDAGVKTRGELTGDGGISFVVPNAGSRHYKVGLVDVGGSNNGTWEDFDFAIYIRAGDTNGDGQGPDVDLVIDNAVLPAHQGITTYAQGDIFRVERVGSDIKFKKGDTVLHTANFDDSTLLTGKAGMYTYNTVIDDLELYGTIDAILQNVDYAYNVRGWLTDINNVDQIFDGKTTDLFNFRINYTGLEGSYNDPGQTDYVPLYNGNIAETIWKNKFGDQEKRSYGYHYDDVNRIRKASSRKGSSLVTKDNFSLWNVSYDRNGNIETLRRSGPTPNMYWDDLGYTYRDVFGFKTNRLLNVQDGGFDTGNCPNPGDCSGFEEGFVDGNDPSVTGLEDYVYDVNGNMTVDNNKGITSITYNHLNLPESVVFGANGQIDYLYDATGIKLEKTVTQGSTNTTEYAGNYIYQDGELQFFNHPEGYVMVVAGTGGETKGHKGGETTTTEFEYVFQYKDHLGNIRLSYSDNDQNGSIDSSEIIEEANYFPFGLKQWGYNDVVSGGNDLAQNWKYGGKELSEELGIGTYDFGARNLDPALGRWFVVDALAEHPNQIDKSPYAYAWNNPVFFTDPDGNCPTCPGGVLDMLGAWRAVKEFGGDAIETLSVINPFNKGAVIEKGLEMMPAAGAAMEDPVGFTEAVKENVVTTVSEELDKGSEGVTYLMTSGLLMLADPSPAGEMGYVNKTLNVATDVAKKVAKKTKLELPGLDSTGKVHGDLPEVKDLGKYSAEELVIFKDDLTKSVQARIDATTKKGPNATRMQNRQHGQRQGQEQDLIKSIEKHLEDLNGGG